MSVPSTSASTAKPSEAPATAAPPPRFSMRPLMFENFVCTLSMMSFVALIGPIARLLGLAPWQTGMAVTVGGLAWVFPSVMALAASAVGPHEQGATASTVAAAHGLGMILGPVVGTLVCDLHPGVPYLLVAVLLVLVALWPAHGAASALEVGRVG